jgi:hypothetical protein
MQQRGRAGGLPSERSFWLVQHEIRPIVILPRIALPWIYRELHGAWSILVAPPGLASERPSDVAHSFAGSVQDFDIVPCLLCGTSRRA